MHCWPTDRNNCRPVPSPVNPPLPPSGCPSTTTISRSPPSTVGTPRSPPPIGPHSPPAISTHQSKLSISHHCSLANAACRPPPSISQSLLAPSAVLQSAPPIRRSSDVCDLCTGGQSNRTCAATDARPFAPTLPTANFFFLTKSCSWSTLFQASTTCRQHSYGQD